MRIVFFLFLGSLVPFLVGCSGQTPKQVNIAPPPNWIRVNVKNVSFYIPGDMKKAPVRGEDSIVEMYQNNRIVLSYDYGRFSDSLKDKSENESYSERTEEIGGKQARIVSYRHETSFYPSFSNVLAIHFADVGNGDNKLTIFARCRTGADYATVEKIFKTIQFK